MRKTTGVADTGARTPSERPGNGLAPVTVSQLTSEAALGVNARRFLELLARHPELPRVRIGKLALVDVEAWRAWLRARAGNDVATPIESDDDEPQTEAEVLARLGLERV